MFDPIVFDNLKVIVEGEIYELDLSGEVSVVNREDFVDLARFTRTYHISFRQHSCCIATLKLSTDLDNIHAELNPRRNEKPGCTVFIQFTYTQDKPFDTEQCEHFQHVLEDIWGETRTITQRLSHEVGNEEYEDLITVTFNRYIYEDQVGDLVEMIDYMLQTLDALEE
ncbi:hypothetical protein [Metabacillus iocasae]|uniref:Group-specific protein n=1 Tax=Priestia iocasae TaxID=2291674 RepID=A0ABS2QUZ3_9BACI|nr:hypothetical protein [Metabacillus iocasae]MBM7703220.1 hypothetical protein [Metabacillus iocasae]